MNPDKSDQGRKGREKDEKDGEKQDEKKVDPEQQLVWNEDDAMGYRLVPDNNEVQTCGSSLFNLSGVTKPT